MTDQNTQTNSDEPKITLRTDAGGEMEVSLAPISEQITSPNEWLKIFIDLKEKQDDLKKEIVWTQEQLTDLETSLEEQECQYQFIDEMITKTIKRIEDHQQEARGVAIKEKA